MDEYQIKDILESGEELVGKRLLICGFVKTGRVQGKGSFAFLEINDGSCAANLQVIVDASDYLLANLTPRGTHVLVEGEIKRTPEGVRQSVELRAERVFDIGLVDSATYPLPKTQLKLEFLRDHLHLRARTDTIAAVARIRHALTYATHVYFEENGFHHVHTPIITTSDCEGAGEMFQVTSRFSEAEKIGKELIQNSPPQESDIEAAKHIVKEKIVDAVSELTKAKEYLANFEIVGDVSDLTKIKECLANLEKFVGDVSDLTKTKECLAKSEESFNVEGGIPNKEGKIDHSHHFFGRPAFLSVSGQLHLETYVGALGKVYTFGPTFRAEHSHTSRHLAEFWMVEAEIVSANLEDDMNCAESYVKFLCKWLLDHCLEDMEFIVKNVDKTAIERLKLVSSMPFERISYTKAVQLLENVTDKEFENKVEWGVDLASEHERYLTEVVFKKPVIVYDYPKSIKAFYMRLNDDGKTVAAMDVLVPKVGELIGGSQREERLDELERRISESGQLLKSYEWYLDLRRYGTMKHSGFGLGFDRMVLFATGLDNIRDAIPFPRYPGRADL